MPVKRFFSEVDFNRVKKDLQFLVTIVQNSYGEYDLAIRDKYLNLYYKGYSIGKIQPIKNGTYLNTVNKRFFEKSPADNQKYYLSKKPIGEYWSIVLRPEHLHPFFQKNHLIAFSSRVDRLPYGELTFEQAIMTDNMGRKDILIIDRQITDTELKRRRLDLLALKQIKGEKYHFLLLEVKLGKNPELKGQVSSQLDSYINHVQEHFVRYKECYEKHFLQKVELGLIKQLKRVEIIPPVKGQILVGSYSGIADSSIKNLKIACPNLDIKHFKYAL